MLSGKHRRIEVAIKYAVDGCRDDQGALLNALHRISEEGGRVVSVTWQPEREIRIDEIARTQSSGYAIVSEHDA